MTRHRPGGGYSHRISKIMEGWYEISWTYDRYYDGSRLRHPTGMRRQTDEAGARRFAKKWGVPMPEDRA